MPVSLTKEFRNTLSRVTLAARGRSEAAARAALENVAVHEGRARGHMDQGKKDLRTKLRARGKALGDVRQDDGSQPIDHLAEAVAYEQWHRLLFTRFLTENGLLHTDAENGDVSVSLQECDELAPELGARDGFDLACRFASRSLPGVFRSDDPTLDLHLALNDEVELRKLLDSLPRDIFLASDSLGWTYQFWQADRKEEVNDFGVKIGADELPAVTQLFTEDYMVDFLLDNTLGAWHAGKVLAANPKLAETAQNEDELRQAVALPGCPWSYLRFIKGESGKWTPAAGTFAGWPKAAKELTCLDPCMGSGHFVVAMFERLVALRLAEEKLDETAAVAAVIHDNLFGLEIDPRCTQIAAFNLALAAWRLVGHCKLPAMNLACSGLAPNTREADWLAIAGDNQKLQRGMERLYRLFTKAAVLGSLINPHAGEGDLLEAAFHELQPLLEKALAKEADTHDLSAEALAKAEMAVTARGLAKAAEILAGQFALVATNVPYLVSGKQSDPLKDFLAAHFYSGRSDLATAFVIRSVQFCRKGGTAALVTPQNWLFLGSYRRLREELLAKAKWETVVRLGAGAFETITGEVVNVGLISLSETLPGKSSLFLGLDVSGQDSVAGKELGLRTGPIGHFAQLAQLGHPDARVLFAETGKLKLLSDYVVCHQGLATGDLPRFGTLFWEIPRFDRAWIPWQGTVENTCDHGGRSGALLWEGGRGQLHAFNEAHKAVRKNTHLRGVHVVGKTAVVITQMGKLPATLYTGERYDDNMTVLMPNVSANLPAIWAYCSSAEYGEVVRQRDQSLKVPANTLAKVPFDLAHWQKVAAEKYPNGLPKPFSSDPTQWLFNGHPKGADHPLHVAVARLLGYQWPRQTGSSFPDCPALKADGLEKYTDDDGIVCLPPINREQPAAPRLRELLAAALGKVDERALIVATDSKCTAFEDWLRDDFFEQHCDLFHQRPFVWHIWDGRKDGFHALVNYHKLDHTTLQKLTYSYLGDWIRHQEEDAKAEKPGADSRLRAARALQAELAKILEGEAPYDIFVRWKPLAKQAKGWHPDLNDNVRLNIRPFMTAADVGKKGSGLLRSKPNIKWDKDRGTEPKRDKLEYPWFWCAEEPDTDPKPGKDPIGNRWNDVHLTHAAKKPSRA